MEKQIESPAEIRKPKRLTVLGKFTLTLKKLARGVSSAY